MYAKHDNRYKNDYYYILYIHIYIYIPIYVYIHMCIITLLTTATTFVDGSSRRIVAIASKRGEPAPLTASQPQGF